MNGCLQAGRTHCELSQILPVPVAVSWGSTMPFWTSHKTILRYLMPVSLGEETAKCLLAAGPVHCPHSSL